MPCARRQGFGKMLAHVPARELRGEIRRLVHDPVTEIRPRNGEPDAGDLGPGKTVLLQKFRNGGGPCIDHALAPEVGGRRPLQKFRGDRLAVGPDGRDLCRRGAAVRSDENLFVHGAVRVLHAREISHRALPGRALRDAFITTASFHKSASRQCFARGLRGGQSRNKVRGVPAASTARRRPHAPQPRGGPAGAVEDETRPA